MHDRVRSTTSEQGQIEPVSGVVSGGAVPVDDPPLPHLVQFYENEEALADVVADFLMEGLRADGVCLAIVTPKHRVLFSERLSAKGVDVESVSGMERLRFLDAEQILARFMIDSAPEWQSFERVLGVILEEAKARAGHGPIHAYGEMVDVLWAQGNHAAAVRLEEMWNDLQREYRFSLLCAYVVANFYKQPGNLKRICSTHSHVLPMPAGTAEVPVLAAKCLEGAEVDGARALQAEIRQRQEVEEALRQCLRSLRHAEANLSSRQRQLVAVTDALPLLIAYVDRDFRYRFVNLEYERWFERTRQDLLGRHVEEVLNPVLFAEVREHMLAALAGQVRQHHARLPHPALGDRRVDVSYIPRIGAEQQVEGFVAVVADVTERIKLEEARRANARRSERLMKITAALAEAVSADQVFQAVVNQVAATLDASSAGLFQFRAESQTVHLLHSTGYSEPAERALRCMSLDTSPSVPAVDAIRKAMPLWFTSQIDLLEHYPHLQHLVTPDRSYQIACLPIMVQDRILGSIGFTFDNAPPIDSEQQDFLLLVARYSGQALERLRLLEAERRSRAQAELAAARAGILSHASKALSEAGDNLSTVLHAITEQVTREYAELCSITLVARDKLVVEALHHRNPDTDRLLRQALDAAPLDLNESALGKVVLTGRSLFMSAADHEAALTRVAPQYRQGLERSRPHSAIICPLKGSDGVLGTLLAFREQTSQAFSQDDVDFLEELAGRVGIAIESSRLHRENIEARLRTELLYGLAREVIAANHIEQVFNAALDALERALSACRSSILTFDLDDVMRFKAWRGLSDEYRQAVEGHSPWARDARDPKPIIVDDAQHDPAMAAYHQLFARERIGALSFIPLVAAGRLVGKFMVYYDTPRALDAQEIDMARAIANHVAAAVVRFSGVAELQRTVRFNEMFAAILGHDLRNPLGAIMASAQVALRRGADERISKPLERIIKSGERMARMIDQLLDFTRVRVGAGIPIEPAPLDLLALLRQIIDELEGANPGCRLQLEPVGDTVGAWDADRLSQVFSNLLGNALQHGSPDAPVQVRVDGRDPASVRVDVTNAGIIPANLLPRLFEPMAASETRQHKPRGLGLGLFITQQIVKAHGGSIDVHSSEHEGTTFATHLPRASDEPAHAVQR